MTGVLDNQPLVILLVIVLLFPVLVIGLGELSSRLARRGYDYANSVSLLRNVVLPLTAIYFIVVYVAELPQDSLVIKLFITAGVILGLVALLGIFNGVLFEGRAARQVPKLFLDLGRILVIAIGIAVVLSLVWGYDLNNLITALGVSSIVLGLALQDTLGNLFNGITLINERPFQVGDFVEVEDHAGEVVEVNWRAVRLLTRERDLIVLPHIKVAQSAIINHSQPEQAWAQKLELGFSYDDPPNKVKRVMMEVMLATPEILHDPPPEAKVDAYADSAINYEVEYYISSFGKREEIKDDFMSRMWYAARREGLNIPFPQLTIHRNTGEAKQREERQYHDDLNYALEMLQIEPERDFLLGHPGVGQRYFGEGEVIVRRGRRSPGLYFLLDGEVRMTTIDFEEDTVEMALLHRGDLFTEVIDRQRRRNGVSVTVVEDSCLLYLDEAVLRSLVNRYPRLAIRLEENQETRRQQIAKLSQQH